MASLPAFENDNVERNLAVCETLFNFFHRLETKTCNTVIMAYDLSRPRIQHCDPLNFRLIEDLCGPRFLAKNLAIVTTNWHTETPAEAEHLESRESDLRSRESCFKDFLERGAQCHRHNYNGSLPTLELLSALAAQSPIPLAIQEEVSTNPAFNRTKIGEVMAQRLQDHLKMVAERSDSLKAELAKVSNSGLNNDKKYAMETDQEALQQTWVRLKRIIEEL
ncbi:hypothetical protein BKA70DRAFT_1522942 [Coprinopsis sp. MPI-PUGE-AT-0042]|nr:hypothetical protein BKA70DRAFT_1522942 [Coprinopsis sp. MPI-PUGE-AT-0042]